MKTYIERAAALSAVRRAFDDEECDCEVMPIVFKALQEVEAADVVEVVRCQNCKYRIYKDMGDDIGMIGGCQVWGVALPGDFYCAHGVLMDKEDEHEAN